LNGQRGRFEAADINRFAPAGKSLRFYQRHRTIDFDGFGVGGENHPANRGLPGDENAMLDYEDIARRYMPIRATGVKLSYALVRLLSMETLEQAARQIGMWVDGTFAFDDMDQSNVLMDFAIHDCWVDGRNAVDSYMALHPPAPRSEKEAILAAMRRSYYSVFQVESVVPGVGVQVHDLLQDQRHFMADRGFSQTAKKGVTLATRAFAFTDFLTTGGAALPMDAATLEKILLRESRPGHRDIAAMSAQRRAEFNATIIRLCLSARNAPKIRYQGVDEEEAAGPRPALPPRGPARNDPCPCGSGRKYKKCCGK
jgi:hypothetical protein